MQDNRRKLGNTHKRVAKFAGAIQDHQRKLRDTGKHLAKFAGTMQASNKVLWYKSQIKEVW